MSDVDDALAAILAGACARDLESDTLDFKRDGRSADDTAANLAAALACFANAGGGTVVVGVADGTPGRDAFLGSRLDPVLTQCQVFDRKDPHLLEACSRRRIRGVELLVATVPPSATVHSVSGRHTERVGSSCQVMSAERITEVMLDRRADDWSARDAGRTTDAIDGLAIEHARAALREHPDPRAAARAALPTGDLLRALGVVTPQGTLTVGGALLFAPGETEELAYAFRRTATGPLDVNEHLAAPVMSALRRVLDLAGTRQAGTPADLPGGVQALVPDIPSAVVREAVVNAVMHRDYRRADRIVVEHSPRRLVVSSPGALVSGVTVSTVLTTASRLRNAHLAGVVRSLGLAETAGTGVDRMYARMLAVGHQPPHYDAKAFHVVVTLLGGRPNATLVRFTSALPSTMRDDADAMLTLRAVIDHGKTTALRIAPQLQRDVADAQRLLADLAVHEDGFLEATRESRTWIFPEYRLRERAVRELGPVLAQRRLPAEESERRILELMRESGQITPGMVRVLLEFSPPPRQGYSERCAPEASSSEPRLRPEAGA